uniref:WWC1-like helical hairpin domain-containing protein n=1 Tax=Chelonoidis abingdonii TaxID=106734 RepID=A0A8C0IS46_CHEAB
NSDWQPIDFSLTPWNLFFFYRIANLKIHLAKLDSEAWPGVLDSERDRLILINEKEELLKEMRFISPQKWTRGEVERLEMERKRLEEDLQAARDTQSKALTERYVTRAKQTLNYWLTDRIRINNQLLSCAEGNMC